MPSPELFRATSCQKKQRHHCGGRPAPQPHGWQSKGPVLNCQTAGETQPAPSAWRQELQLVVTAIESLRQRAGEGKRLRGNQLIGLSRYPRTRCKTDASPSPLLFCLDALGQRTPRAGPTPHTTTCTFSPALQLSPPSWQGI
eukprot:UN4741